MKCREIEISYNRAKKNSELKTITRSSDVYANWHEFLKEGTIDLKEYFYIIHLNRSGKVIGVQKISEGGTAATTVDIKIIMASLLKSLASAVILVHNHPSGGLTPSLEDNNLTKRIADAAKLFDIRVNDHIIVTDDGYYSYADNGRI